MNPVADFQSGHDRRHNDPPNLWLAVLAGSLVVHLLLLLSGRLFLFRVNSQKSAGVAAPIELVTLSPKSSSKATRSARSAAPKVVAAPVAQQRAVSSEAVSQRAVPIQPSIAQQPIPTTPRPTPQIKPSVRPTIAASTPKPPPLPSVRVRPTVPDPISPEPLPSQNPDPMGANTGNQPPIPDANSPVSSGSADPNNRPSGVPDASTNSSEREPSAPEPIGSNQTLSSELSVESTVGQLAKAGELQSSGKSAILQDSPTQILSIQFPPALKLTSNQVLDLTVLVVIDNKNGKVLSSDVLPESRAFQEISGLNRDDLSSLVDRIFRNLTFKVEVESGPGESAPQSPWKVPVTLKVIQ